jgi:mannose/fructose/N-acetylgalactosamine-specific phosphotransferase system component IIB
MAIVLARVDNRLVHGQILSAWLPTLAADALVVLDDEAARNTLVRSAMELAIPPDVSFDVAPVSRAKETLARLPASAKIIVLLRDVADAARAVEGGLALTRLNLGNIHFSHGRVAVTQAVNLSEDELQGLERLEVGGVQVELKTLPRDPALTLAEIRKRVQGAT